MPSNFPHKVIEGPIDLMGLESPMLYNTSGIKKIRAILDQGSSTSITGKHIRAGIESHKLEIGYGASLFEINHKVLKEYEMKTWWKHASKMVWKT
eukprot:12684259-Ditylum_brightwellii.AAC.1